MCSLAVNCGIDFVRDDKIFLIVEVVVLIRKIRNMVNIY